MNKYYFIDKEQLRNRAKDITARIEAMYESFMSFVEIIDGLSKDTFIDFIGLNMKAGLSPKKLKGIKNSIDEYRRVYFDLLAKIYQTKIDDFIKVKGGAL